MDYCFSLGAAPRRIVNICDSIIPLLKYGLINYDNTNFTAQPIHLPKYNTSFNIGFAVMFGRIYANLETQFLLKALYTDLLIV